MKRYGINFEIIMSFAVDIMHKGCVAKMIELLCL